MKIVKLSINIPKEGLLRQTLNCNGIWGNYKFVINEELDECDFWVVYSKGQKRDDISKVAPENMIFVSGEPETVYHYAKSFINKFGVVITSRKDIRHSSIIYAHPAQPWWVGRELNADGQICFSLEFHDFEKSPSKSKLISVISSNRGITKGHKDRIKFVQQLKAHFGDKLDLFGKGINGFEDKWDTLKDYKYHIVIENSSYPDYWTEKLADSYLAEVFPFYYGCTNLEKYFSPLAYEKIDVYDLAKSINIINTGIVDNLYVVRRASVLEAKHKVLYEYNIFPMICGILDNLDASLPKKTISIRNEMSYFDPYKIPMILERFYFNCIYK